MDAKDQGVRGGVAERMAIVMADVAGTTALMAMAGELIVADALQEFFGRVNKLQTAHRGRVVKTFGDGFLAVFRDGADALAFATELRQSLIQVPIQVMDRRMTVRIGIHSGPVVPIQTSYGGDVFGEAINLAGRVTSMANPGEILLTEAARRALPAEQQALTAPRELVQLKGVNGLVEISRLDLAGV